MKMRVMFILILLVVTPTAILSLLASRSLMAWESEFQNNLKASALNAIDNLQDQVTDSLERDLDQVRNTLSDVLSRGSKLEFGKAGSAGAIMLDKQAQDLARHLPAVKRVYLFMNPWGFLYPQSGDAALPPEKSGLVAKLQKEIASASSLTASMLFSYKDSVYLFSLLKDSKGLYAGYELDPTGLDEELMRSARSLSGKGILLIADAPGQQGDGLIITDSLGLSSSGPSGGEAYEKSISGQMLFSQELSAPLDFIDVKAFLADPDGAMRSKALSIRLSGWAIALLAAAIVIGVAVLFYETSMEIRRAKVRGDFMMGVSHDLRTPISSIKMLSETMLLGNVTDAEKKKRFLTTIGGECDHLADMIERVLFFMRQEHGASVLTFSDIAPVRLLEDVVTAFNTRVHSEMASLSVDGEISGVRGDAGALSKVFFNLLDNARKYSSGQESLPEDVKIQVTVQEVDQWKGRWVEISVKDQGVGIDPKELKKIFRKFYRASIEKDGKVRGVGLGLALCKDIVRMHKGRITAESQPGQGSTFTVFLPVN